MRNTVFLIITVLLTAISTSAFAQGDEGRIVLAQAREEAREPGGLFRFLFRKRDSRRRELRGPDDRVRGFRKQRRSRDATRKARRQPAPAGPPKGNIVTAKLSGSPPELDPTRQRVLVAGDFFAKALAQGLAEAFAENPNIRVIVAGNGSSGLVRDDFYNWNEALPKFVERYKPAATVIMLGGNDRQAIRGTGGAVQHGSEAWDAAYRGRVKTFMQVLSATSQPVLWAGLVPVRSPSLSRAYSGFNTIYREIASTAGFSFIEMWNGFADGDGRFVSRGPDINGQSRQLRVSDGLNLTRHGRRKLAFFAEKDLRQILGAGGGPQLAAVDPAGDASEASRVSAMVPMDAYAGGADSGLATFATAEEEKAESEGEEESVAGAPPGRIDDFLWPPRPAAAPAKPQAEVPVAAGDES